MNLKSPKRKSDRVECEIVKTIRLRSASLRMYAIIRRLRLATWRDRSNLPALGDMVLSKGQAADGFTKLRRDMSKGVLCSELR